MKITTEIGYATVDDIFVRGHNLSTELIPELDFVDMIALCILGRRPDAKFKRMLNVLLVTATDHGFTPSSMCSRLTFLGAPESLQGAVAAGLLGAGNRYLGSMQNVSEMLLSHTAGLEQNSSEDEFRATAVALLDSYKRNDRHVEGFGHPIHVNGDPRVASLRRLSQENGYYGKAWRLLDALEAALAAKLGKRLPLNGAGALGAISADMGLDPMIAKGLALVGRTAGLVGHVFEETKTPVAQSIWKVTLDAAS